MPIRIPRLSSGVSIVSKDGLPVQKFQQWWQSVAVAIEGAVTTLEGTVADITAILVRLGFVEITADGALELAESAIEPGGEIKSAKVVTESITPNGVTERYLAVVLSDVALTDGVEVEVLSVSVTKIEDESDIDLDVSLRLQSSDDIRGNLRLYRGATQITSFGPYMDSPGTTFRIPIIMLHTDVGVAAGVYSYRVTFQRSGGASALSAVSGSLVRAKEYKR